MWPKSQSVKSPPLLTRRRGLWFFAGFALISSFLWNFYPLPDARPLLEAIPLRSTHFAGTNLPLSDVERAAIGRAGICHRRYQSGGREFFLTAFDGSGNRHAVHDPRYCFQGAGWRIIRQTGLPAQSGSATLVEIGRGDDRAEIVFWFFDGTQRHSSFPRYWCQTTLRRFTLGRSGTEPILVVLQSYGAGNPAGMELARLAQQELNL